jgi:hypothetical protein
MDLRAKDGDGENRRFANYLADWRAPIANPRGGAKPRRHHCAGANSDLKRDTSARTFQNTESVAVLCSFAR